MDRLDAEVCRPSEGQVDRLISKLYRWARQKMIGIFRSIQGFFPVWQTFYAFKAYFFVACCLNNIGIIPFYWPIHLRRVDLDIIFEIAVSTDKDN